MTDVPFSTRAHLALWCHRQFDGQPDAEFALYTRMCDFLDEHGWDLADRGWPAVRELMGRQETAHA